jgi:hypothetical protein
MLKKGRSEAIFSLTPSLRGAKTFDAARATTRATGAGAPRRKSGFGLYRLIAGGGVICALGWAELGQECAYLVPELFAGSLGRFAQEGLELGEGVFDRVEIGIAGGQVERLSAGGLDGGAHGSVFVAAEVSITTMSPA